MKHTALSFLVCMIAVSAQYFGSQDWANDMLNYTNMSMYISTKTFVSVCPKIVSPKK